MIHSVAIIASICSSLGLLVSLRRLYSLRRIGMRYEREVFISMIWSIVLVLELITVFAH